MGAAAARRWRRRSPPRDAALRAVGKGQPARSSRRGPLAAPRHARHWHQHPIGNACAPPMNDENRYLHPGQLLDQDTPAGWRRPFTARNVAIIVAVLLALALLAWALIPK